MNEPASNTALATALMRSLHARLNPHPLIDDSWGERLVPEAQRRQFTEQSLLGSPAFPNVITRTRYAEDALEADAARGVGQYVLIGAGFDSFCLRRPKFAADLTHVSVAEALAASPFDSRQPAFFSWLGVTMYLTRAANLATLRAIALCSPPGSELVFTYMDAARLRSPSPAFEKMQSRLTAKGESFLSGFDPDSLGEEIARCGLELIEDLSGEEALARYGRRGDASLSRPSSSHIALARVKDPLTA